VLQTSDVNMKNRTSPRIKNGS